MLAPFFGTSLLAIPLALLESHKNLSGSRFAFRCSIALLLFFHVAETLILMLLKPHQHCTAFFNIFLNGEANINMIGRSSIGLCSYKLQLAWEPCLFGAKADQDTAQHGRRQDEMRCEKFYRLLAIMSCILLTHYIVFRLLFLLRN